MLLGKKIQFNSLLTQDEALDCLKENIHNPKWHERPDFSMLFVGVLKENTFRITRLKHTNSSVTPMMKGVVHPAVKGCQVQAKIRMHPLVLIGLVLFTLGIIAVTVFFILLTGLDNAVDFIFFVPLAVVSLILGMIVFMLLSETSAIENELKELLHAAYDDVE